MEVLKIQKAGKIQGECIVPPDKSISQRAVMLGALAKGLTVAENFLVCEDSLRTISAFRNMGVVLKLRKKSRMTVLEIKGRGLSGLKPPKKKLYIGNSGTTMRLIAGILAAQKFKSVLSGDRSLLKRPMRRIIEPLRLMGAHIHGRRRKHQEYPPLTIEGQDLRAISYAQSLPSAQVKSCILLGGIFAEGKTCVREKLKTRDHTERMLRLFKAAISVRGLRLAVCGGKELTAPGRMFIPGDISSAAFFIIAAILIPNSRLVIRNVGLNPTRTSLLRLLKRMGADIRILKKGACLYAFEPYADIEVRARPLKAITLHEKDIAYCIDELPILCVAACFAKGTTRIYGAAELRVKETDRIHSMVANLKRMGACIRNVNNDVIIKGTGRLRSARVSSFGDHRTAMSMTIAGLLAEGQTEIRNTRCVNKSFPGFQRVLKAICVP